MLRLRNLRIPDFMYTKPKCPLPQLDRELPKMKNIKEMYKKDLAKAFYQYRVTPKSSKELAFEFRGRDGRLRRFTWLVLAFGISAATFLVQSINRVFTDYYALKFNKFIIIYIDDFGYEKKEEEFEKLAKSVGFIFNNKKSSNGEVVELLGWSIDFSKKTAKITKDKETKIAAATAKMLGAGKTTVEELQSFMGRIAFASRACKYGRLNSFYLDRLLAKIQAEGLDDQKHKVMQLEEHHKAELRFWRDISNHEPISFRHEARLTLEKKIWTDASQKKWAWKDGEATRAGGFEGEAENWPIILKEATALKLFFDESNITQTQFQILVDNKPLVQAFNKKFSKNEILHQMIKEIYLKNFRKGNAVSLKWVSTSLMAEQGADGASRGVYIKDIESLSEKGVEKARKLMSLKEGEKLFDLFASPVDNVFEVKYFSNHIDQEDPKNLEEGAFELLNRLRIEKRKLGHVFWAFPPKNLLKNFLFALIRTGVEGKVFILLEADMVLEAAGILRSAFVFTILKFSKARDTRLFQNRPNLPRSVIRIDQTEA